MADKISWIDPNGTEHLFETDMKVLSGMNGRWMPPISYTEDKVPFQPGSRLRNVNVEPRDVDIPIYIKAKSEMNLKNKMRQTTRMLNPLKGDGKLKVISPDGSQRELSCRYLTGLEGREERGIKGVRWQKAILVFRAFDPFWYDTAAIVKSFKINESPATFFPFFPLRLTSSSVFADTSIDNTGDVETWPEWIITGPGENIVLRNMTTGEITHIETSVGDGESITINTKPFEKTVTKNDGTNLFHTLTDESSLWALQEGKNSIRLEMSNANEASSIQLTYRNRYWGP
ncbi:phage distal tail protein [Bacillus sp. 1P02SD]|uniref:phage distal tail protein n=1 Tax=Bacillus sp. 1P02SD TaxID=3132264 RepID=UPI0039A28C81